MSDDLVVYEGRQYPADKLPEGVKKSDCVPIAEWFAANRSAPEHKAVEKPVSVKPAAGKPGK